MIALWPGRIRAGRVSDAMAMNIDLFPTLLSLAGVPLPSDREIDGRDLTELLEGDESAESPDDVLFYFPVLGGRFPVAARDARFKYRVSTGDLGRDKPMLNDVHLDQESHNLIRRFPDEASRLAEAIRRFDGSLAENQRGWLDPVDETRSVDGSAP
jgi:arylsulfatase A-like enzyme